MFSRKQLKNFCKRVLSQGTQTTTSSEYSRLRDLLFQVDPTFQNLYNQGLAITGTAQSGDAVVNKRQARFYNLVNLYSLASGLNGSIAEVGCWKGLSSYLLNKTISAYDPGYKGKDFWIIDSFEGLSEASIEDQDLENFVPPEIIPGAGTVAGSFNASLDQVQGAMSEFPDINYIKGWVPGVLDQVPDSAKWKFVHIDLDLYEPIKGAFEFFSLRMIPGGVIVFDDYGSLYWPGARKAVNEISAHANGRLVILSTGQAFWQAS